MHPPSFRRPRRNRQLAPIREALAETSLELRHLVLPIFVMDSKEGPEEIKTLPGIYRWTESTLPAEIESCLRLGLKNFALFPAISEKLKNPMASEALNPSGLIPRVLKALKARFPQIVLYSDVALDPYSSDGHDGLVQNGEILNDESVKVLAEMALVHAAAGADFVCPSDMMDHRVAAIRARLDSQGHQKVGILSYTAKYASSFYGPFREALGSAPKSGDKKTYQMDYRNRREALLEAELDTLEGADILMVKPAMPYLDILRDLRNSSQQPLAAYQVSGEYAMLKFASLNGAMNLTAAIHESLTAIRRAGADMIFTYFAKDFAEHEAKKHEKK